jgi:hypothetical protein
MTPTPLRWRAPVADQVARQQVGVVQQVGDDLGRVQHLDHARPVVGQRGVHQLRPAPGHEGLAALGFGARVG